MAECTIEAYVDDVKVLEQDFKCFTKNFSLLLRSAFMLANETLTDVNSTGIDCPMYYTVEVDGGIPTTPVYSWYAPADMEDDTCGIVIGTGTSDTDEYTHALDTKIDHGDGSGEMKYYECTVQDMISLEDVLIIPIIRPFINMTAANMVVTEVGLYVTLPNGAIVCIVRDKLESAVTIYPNGTLAIVMNIKMNV
jgi:hypothetical protein